MGHCEKYHEFPNIANFDTLKNQIVPKWKSINLVLCEVSCPNYRTFWEKKFFFKTGLNFMFKHIS